jgi:pyridoxal phosphate enzyme (YggS family)
MVSPDKAEQIRRALDQARERIAAAAAKAGRPEDAVRLLLATKTQPAEVIRVALEAGSTLIGENRVQELVAKADELADIPHEAHLIGPLQSNKIPAALRHATCIQTVTDLRLGEKLSSRTADRSVPLEVMIEVNTSGEDTKAGCAPEDARELAAALGALPGLLLTGFMTVGLNSDDAVRVARSYALLREIRDQVAADAAPGTSAATELSMGMSGDLELAIAEGATMVRLGTAVFGARPSRVG